MRNAVHAPTDACRIFKKTRRKERGQQRQQAAWVQNPEEGIIDRNIEDITTEAESSSSPEIQPSAAEASSTIIHAAADWVPSNNSQKKRSLAAAEAEAQEAGSLL